MSKIEGKFKIKRVTNINSLQEGSIVEIPESDLCLQTDSHIIQMEYVKPDKSPQYEIKPGVFTIEDSMQAGVHLVPIALKERNLLSEINNTHAITKEAKTFFNKLSIYDQLNRIKKRGVLIYSKPGMGKSSAIEKFCKDFIQEDPGSVVAIWPTAKVDADAVSSFLSTQSEYNEACTRMILVMEDIGGGERESEQVSPVDSSMLNLLDGVGVTFKLPTFIIATTNHPEQLLESLADRPERFDLVLALNPPTSEERVKLLEFISKRPLSTEEQDAISNTKGTENFSIAHLAEIAVRSLLHDKSYKEVIEELIEHTKKYKRNFEDKRSLGIGI